VAGYDRHYDNNESKRGKNNILIKDRWLHTQGKNKKENEDEKRTGEKNVCKKEFALRVNFISITNRCFLNNGKSKMIWEKNCENVWKMRTNKPKRLLWIKGHFLVDVLQKIIIIIK
jgi:hypothetical protein